MPTLSDNKLVRFITDHGPNTVYKGKPLIAWLIERPNALQLVLDEGANPNIDYEIEPGLSITTCCCCKIVLKKIRHFKRSLSPFEDVLSLTELNTTQEKVLRSLSILTDAGGRSMMYRDYIRLDIN